MNPTPAPLPPLVPASTALILIDLQNAIVGRELAPHPAAAVVRNGRRLADAFRRAGAMVVYVRVDLATAFQPDADEPPLRPPGSPRRRPRPRRSRRRRVSSRVTC